MVILVGATLFSSPGSRVNAIATTERRIVDGEPAYLLAAIRGDLATPALESVKSSFSRLTTFVDRDAALVLAAAPPVIAEAAAIVLIYRGRATAALTRTGLVLRQREDRLTSMPAGQTDLLAGERWIACSGDLPSAEGHPPMPRVAAPSSAVFRNDTLDDELHKLLALLGPRETVAAAAAQCDGE